MSHPHTTPRGAALLTLAALMLCSVSAYATGFEYLIKNQKSQTDSPGPVLVLKATDYIEGGSIQIEGAGKSQKIKLEKMNPGKTREIPIKVPNGKHTMKVVIDTKGLGETTGQIAFDFEVVRAAPITLTIDRDKVDTAKGVIPFKIDQPLDRMEVDFYDTNGQKIGSEVTKYEGKQGNLELTWQGGQELGAVQITAYDVNDFWTSVLLEPWWIEIEHEEIIFDFGKATWQPSEEPKLKKSLAEIKAVMSKNAKHRPDMRLYVAGYTDTVGSAEQNRKLSNERASAIARWFKKNGVDMPVYYQGFGESVLAVKTADETPEERNRRAIYVLGNGPPPTSAELPRAIWMSGN